jgi:hypothetical protein
MPVESVFNSMARMERTKDGMCNSTVVYISANKGYDPQLFKVEVLFRKGGRRRLVKTILILTQV